MGEWVEQDLFDEEPRENGLEVKENLEKLVEEAGERRKPGLLWRATKGVLTIFIVVYFWGCNCSVLYFNWRYAQTAGFLEWLAFGQVVPTLQAAGWPYFMAKGYGESTSDAQMDKCMMAWGAALRMSPGQERRLQELEKSFEHAQRVDTKSLNRQIPGLGDVFEDCFISGLEKKIEGIRTKDQAVEASGDMMIAKWQNFVVKEGAKRGWEVVTEP